MAAPARSGWQGNKVGSHDGVRLGRLSRRDTPCIVFCRFLFSSADRLLGFIFYHDLCFLSCVLSAAGRGMYYRRRDDECLLRIACSKPSLSPRYASFYFGDVLCWCVVVVGGGGCFFFSLVSCVVCFPNIRVAQQTVTAARLPPSAGLSR